MMNVAADSITLAQLKQLVKDIPKKKQTVPIKFDYNNGLESRHMLIDEFFSLFERNAVLEGEELAFKWLRQKQWNFLPDAERMRLLSLLSEQFEQSSGDSISVDKSNYAKILLYISQGAFGDLSKSKSHLDQIETNCKLLVAEGFFPIVINHLKHVFSLLKTTMNPTNPKAASLTCDLDVSLSVLFMLVINCNLESELLASNPSLILFLLELVDNLNFCTWNVRYPIKKILYLLWKVIEKTLGSLEDYETCKKVVRETYDLAAEQPSVKKPKTSIHDLKNTFDYCCSRFVGYAPSVNLLNAPYYDLISRYDYHKSSTVASHLPSSALLIGPESIFYTPMAIEEKFKVTAKLLYVPVGRVQCAEEVRYMQHPEFKPKDWTEQCLPSNPVDLERIEACEEVYRQCLPHIGAYIVSILKILLSVSTKVTSTAKNSNSGTNTRTIAQAVHDILSEDLKISKHSMSSLEIAEYELEATRNKEVTAKAISFIILLLLKHSKSYHWLQFEFISQLLVDANCLLLILKIFNQDISNILLKNDLDFTFQSFFIFCDRNRKFEQDFWSNNVVSVASPTPITPSTGPTTALNSAKAQDDEEDDGPAGDQSSIMACNRNFHLVINLSRILQMVTKGKEIRVNFLVQYKAVAILKKLLKFEQPELVRYTLKIIKSLLPYVGRKWRQANMRIVTMMYTNLRPELTDAWLNSIVDSTTPDNQNSASNVVGSPDDFARFDEDQIDMRILTSSYNFRKYPRLFEQLNRLSAAAQNKGTGNTNGSGKKEQSPSGTLYKQSMTEGGMGQLGSVLDEYDVEVDKILLDNYEKWLEVEVYSRGEDDEDYLELAADNEDIDQLLTSISQLNLIQNADADSDQMLNLTNSVSSLQIAGEYGISADDLSLTVPPDETDFFASTPGDDSSLQNMLKVDEID